MLRGAVFFIGMGLWGTKCVQTLIHKPQSVLPSFKSALASGNPILAFEISITCQRLVKKFGHELHVCAWDSILGIVELLLQIVEVGPKSEQSVSLKQNAHELLTIIEKLYQTQAYNGSADDLFHIVEAHMRSRPNDSLLLLVSYRSQAINPAKSDWISNLLHFIDIYYYSTINTKVRLKVLELIEAVVLNNMDVYEKELIDNVILSKFQNISDEKSYAVQENAVKFLLQICLCSRTDRCISLLQALERFVRVDFNFDVQNTKLVSVTETALDGFAKLFQVKFHGDVASHAVEAFKLMLTFLEGYYANQQFHKHPTVFKEIRQRIVEIFLDIRGNSILQLSLNSRRDVSSSVVWVNYKELENLECPRSPLSKPKPAFSPDLILPFQRAFSCFSQGIVKENYWPILELTINGICDLLDNKCLILSLDRQEVDFLAEALTGLISSPNRVLTLTGAPPTFKRPQLMGCGLKAITVVVSFHNYMTITRQRQVLRCLEAGFNSKSAKQCISATTLCVIEMKSEALLRNLPSILLRLSQMSATVSLATSVLELLSTLAQLPKLFSNFNDDQYMSVFKIALQHADPEKFSLYVVSLAHHVINMWFIKCRLAFRPDFVRYITLSLQNNCRTPSNLQHNLIEACIDVMARYTFSNSMPVSKRPEKPKTKSKNGRSSTWLLGNRLITITTDITLTKEAAQCSNAIDSVENTEAHALQGEKKPSIEAPGKLQSSDEVSVKSTRHRHKSSGALLRKASNNTDAQFACLSENNFVDDDGTTNNFNGCPWAEIFIRRPSGNNSWILNSHQLSLVLQTNDFACQVSPQSPSLSLSTSDLTKQDDADSAHGDSPENSWSYSDETGGARQRSRTVSSAHDFVADAAARAKAKAREQLTRNQHSNLSMHSASIKPIEKHHQLLSPEFIFLQFFHSAMVTDGLQRPLLLPNSATVERSVSVLDLIPPYDTWEAGVVYVRPGQSSDGKAILYNQHGSVRYQNLLGSLGNLVSLSDCDPSCTHLGGLDYAEGEDGDATYVWQENVMQMVFHIATLMPNLQSGVSNKQRHIGNDYVTVVYDDNAVGNYVPGSIVKGQFLSVEIIINPLDIGYNIINMVYHKPALKDILQMDDKYTVSDDRLGLLVRQLALHASMASAANHHKTPEKFVSKPLSRLKHIKHIRSRAIQEVAWKSDERAKRYQSSYSPDLYALEDFSDFVT